MIRNKSQLNSISSEAEDVWIENFVTPGQKNLLLNKQQSMKNLTIGFNALNGISVFELRGLAKLERVVIMRGGFAGGSGRLRITKCTSLKSIEIGEYAFIKYKYMELIDLPQLESVKMDGYAFQNVQTVIFEGKNG